MRTMRLTCAALVASVLLASATDSEAQPRSASVSVTQPSAETVVSLDAGERFDLTDVVAVPLFGTGEGIIVRFGSRVRLVVPTKASVHLVSPIRFVGPGSVTVSCLRCRNASNDLFEIAVTVSGALSRTV